MQVTSWRVSLCLASVLVPLESLPGSPLTSFVQQDMPRLERIYREFHAHPELSFQEEKSAATIAKILSEQGYEVTQKVGGWGVVGILRNGQGPTLMLRADMDALPVKEQTSLPYQSQVIALGKNGEQNPVMHACGHDVHMTVLLGAATYLQHHKNLWQGTLVLVAQPAEERGAGAKAMLDDGLFRKFPRPDYNFALHVSASQAAGTVGYTPGYALANVDWVDIAVKGIGGHGAYPHKTIDPVVLAAKLVLSLQTIISREIDPTSPSVLSVGAIHGGTKHNIIPDQVDLQLTLRSYSAAVREQTLAAIKRMAEGLARAEGLPEDKFPLVQVREQEATPSTYNDPLLTQRLAKALGKVLPAGSVWEVPPTMGGEDFGRYGQVSPPIPSAIFWLGAVAKDELQKAARGEKELPSLHSPLFAPEPRPTIETGVVTLSTVALDLLKLENTAS